MPKFLLDLDNDGYINEGHVSLHNLWKNPQVSSYNDILRWGIDVPQIHTPEGREYHLNGVVSYLGIPHVKELTNPYIGDKGYPLSLDIEGVTTYSPHHPYGLNAYHSVKKFRYDSLLVRKSTNYVQFGHYLYIDSLVQPTVNCVYKSGSDTWDLVADLTDSYPLGNGWIRWEYTFSFTAGGGTGFKSYYLDIECVSPITRPFTKHTKNFTYGGVVGRLFFKVADIKASLGQFYRQYAFDVKSSTPQTVTLELCKLLRNATNYDPQNAIVVDTQTLSVTTDWQTFNLVTYEDNTEVDNGYFLRLTHTTDGLVVRKLFYNESSSPIPLGVQDRIWGRYSTVSFSDNLTPYVLRASWKYGKQSQDEFLPYEGELTVELNNESRLFSPDNKDSPLYGLLNVGILGKIVDDDNNVLFTGFLRSVEVETGTNRTLTATLTLAQGVERIRQSFVSSANLENVRAIDIIKHIFQTSTVILPTTPKILQIDVSVIGDSVLHSANSYLSPLSAEGTRTFAYFGSQWGASTTVSEALSQVCVAENGHILINAKGELIFTDKVYFANKNNGDILDLDKVSQQADYFWGDYIINNVEVDVKQLRANPQNTIIWQQTELVPLQEGETKEIVLSLEDRYNKSIVVLGELEPHITAYRGYGGVKEENKFKAKIDIKGGRYTLVLKNESDTILYWEGYIEVKRGDNNTSSVVKTFMDKKSVKEIGGVYTKRIELYDIIYEEQVKSIAYSYMLYRSLPYGRFSHVIIRNRSVFDVGQYFRVRETQTATEKPVYIIGVSGILDNNYLSMEYDTEIIPDKHFFSIGDPIGGDVNLCKPYKFLPNSGNGVKGELYVNNPSGSYYILYEKHIATYSNYCPAGKVTEIGESIDAHGRPYVMLPRGTYSVYPIYNNKWLVSIGGCVLKHRNTGAVLSGIITLEREEPAYVEILATPYPKFIDIDVAIQFTEMFTASELFITAISNTAEGSATLNQYMHSPLTIKGFLPTTPHIIKLKDTYIMIRGTNIYMGLTTDKHYDSIEEIILSGNYTFHA